MSQNNDPIGKALNLPVFNPVVDNILTEANKTSVLEDFKLSRANLLNMMEETNSRIEELSLIAAQSQNPRVYEVLGQLIKISASLSKDLLDVQEKIRKMENVGENVSEKAQTINNTVMVFGTTADLQRLLKDAKNKKVVIDDNEEDFSGK